MNSASVFAGNDGCTTSTPGSSPISMMGTKSSIGSKGSLGYSEALMALVCEARSSV